VVFKRPELGLDENAVEEYVEGNDGTDYLTRFWFRNIVTILMSGE